MKNKKTLALVLAVVLMVCQFSLLGTISAFALPAVDNETVGEVVGTVLDGQGNCTLDSGNFRFYDSGVNAYNVDLSAMWSSNAGLIEFDLYVSDADTLETLMVGDNAKFKVWIVGRDNSVLDANTTFSFAESGINHDGWNHIVLPKSKFTNKTTDWSHVGRILAAIEGQQSGFSSYNAITYGIANFKGTRITSTNYSTIGETYENQLGAGAYVGRLGNDSGARIEYPLQALNVGNTDWSALFEKGFIEFDFYVANYENLMESLTQDVNGNSHSLVLNFYISSNAGSINGNFFRYNLGAQLKHDGWNHVVLYFGSANEANVAAPIQTASFDQTSVKSFGLRFVGTPAGNIAAAFDLFAIKNLTASSVATVGNGTVGEVVGTVFSDPVMSTRVQASSYRFYDSQDFTDYNADLSAMWSSDVGLVEFDLFVSDIDALETLMGSTANFKLQVVGNQSSVLNAETTFSFAESGIDHNGWNHIVIEKSRFGGTVTDWSSVKRVLIGIDGAGSIPYTSFQDNIVYGMANFKGTIRVPVVSSHSLVLADSIGVNFHMDLSTLTAEEKAASYMTFDVTNNDIALQDEFDGTDVNAGGKYCFTCYLSSVQMAETITPTLHYGDGKTVTGAAYSAKDYIDYVVAHSGSFDSTVVDLVKSLGDYGHYAQIYLGGRNNWVAGTDYTALAKYRAADYGSDDYTAKATALSSAAVSKDIDGTAVTGLSYSLNFDSNTYVNVQLRTTDSLFASATVDGNLLYLSASGKLRTQGLSVLQLDEPITITGNGSSNTNTFTITLSGLSYVRAILSSGTTSDAAKNAVSALYDYYQAAVAYQATLS